MDFTRRHFNQVFASGALAGTVFSPFCLVPQAFAQADVTELMVKGPLDEMTLGDADAPVTVIEYASMTCGHCARFHIDVFPQLKEQYIETGKVHFILREFPLDPLAAGGFMLARCAGNDLYFPMVDVLFEKQADWTKTNDPVTALFNIAKQAGFTKESFDSCLSNQQLLDGINEVKNRGSEKFDVDSTPTFFINGQKASGVQSIEELGKLIDPHIKS